MPSIATFGTGFIARPLLDVSRGDLEALARKAKLEWIEDPSNADTRFSRNFLRLRLMPLMREHWPGVDRAVARSATHMAEAASLLSERATADLAGLADGAGLSVSALRGLPMGRRRNALRAFIARHGVEMPETSRLKEISGALLTARADAQPEVAWAAARIVRRGGRLELRKTRESAQELVAKSWRWQTDRRLILEHGALVLIDDAAGPIDLARLPRAIDVRARRGGERIRPGAKARTRTLKSLLQDSKIPVEERAQIPLLFVNEQLIAAGDRWIDASISATVKSRRRARLRWIRTR
jgi:tRNA(Ile)-lysidine synthase